MVPVEVLEAAAVPDEAVDTELEVVLDLVPELVVALCQGTGNNAHLCLVLLSHPVFLFRLVCLVHQPFQADLVGQLDRVIPPYQGVLSLPKISFILF